MTSVKACTSAGPSAASASAAARLSARMRGDRLGPSSAAAGEHDAGAERLGQHEGVAGPGPALGEDAVGVDEALHGEPEDRLLRADGVAAGDHTAGVGHDLGGGGQDGRDGLDRQLLGEGGDVEREDDRPAHGEHVAAGVGRGDGAEVGGIVDERREEVGGRHEGQVVGQPEDGGVVERRQADEQPGGRRAGEVAHERGRAAPPPTWRRTRRTRSTRSAGDRSSAEARCRALRRGAEPTSGCLNAAVPSTGSTTRRRAPLRPGTTVEVRSRFDGSWSAGFEVAEVDADGYIIRRLSDGRSSGPFPPDDVRRERSSRPGGSRRTSASSAAMSSSISIA